MTNRRIDGLAFTLTEILVVVALVVLLIGVGVPSMKSIFGSARVENNARTIESAVTAARSFALQSQHFGAAALFTPGNEIRYITSTASVYNTDYTTDSGTNANLSPGAIIYLDVDGQDYVRLPANVGVLGVARVNVGGGNPARDNARANPILLQPPFAVRFDRTGMLLVDDPGRPILCYDGNYDGANYPFDSNVDNDTYPNLTAGQPIIPEIQDDPATDGSIRENPFYKPAPGNEYNPDDWDPASPTYYDTSVPVPDPTLEDKPAIDPDSLQQRLPFEQIETVTAILVFDKEQFRAAGFSLESHPGPQGGADITSATSDSGFIYPLNFRYQSAAAQVGRDPRRWLLTNGTILVFNRYSGKVVKEQ